VTRPGSAAAACPVDELRNADRASLLGARIVMLLALLRADTRVGFADKRPRLCQCEWCWEGEELYCSTC
jgi:hypothetical protein